MITTQTTLDRFPVKDLPGRYSLGRSQEHERRKFLGIEAKRDGNTSYVSADDLLRLDELDRHLKSGGSLASFGVSGGSSGRQPEVLQILTSASLADKSDEQTGQSELLQFLSTALEAISRSLPAAQPLANLEAIDRACEKGWLLSTSQLCELLGVRSISGQAIERYGFRFTRCGKNGREGAWAIAKLKL